MRMSCTPPPARSGSSVACWFHAPSPCAMPARVEGAMREPVAERRSGAGGRAHSRGVALVIALVLLLLVTLLATTGMAVSIADLVMAGNEQFHRRAADAASAGVEAAVAQLAKAGASDAG